MDPKTFFEQIELPGELTDEGVRKAIDENIFRIFYGGLNRPAYEERVFSGKPKSWPLGHLADHRVSVPERMAESLHGADGGAIAALLKHSLNATGEEGAVELVGHALGLHPATDAQALVALKATAPELWGPLIRGRLEDARRLAARSKASWAAIQNAMRLMLLYYGSLEVQLIAARARAIAEFGFGVESSRTGPTVGGLLNGWQSVMGAIVYAQQAAQGRRPQGAVPSLITDLENKVRKWAARLGKSEAELQPYVVALLSGLIGSILGDEAMPAVDAWQATATPPARGETRGKQPKHSRMKISTLLDGRTSGEQIAFACLRLDGLREHALELLPRKGARPADIYRFNERPFPGGVGNASFYIYYVAQVTLIEDAQTGLLPSLINQSLVDRIQDWSRRPHGKDASSMLKQVRTASTSAMRAREIVDPSLKVELTGAQRWDVLPDYRLGVKPTSVSKTLRPSTIPRRQEQEDYQNKHGVRRLPKRSAKP